VAEIAGLQDRLEIESEARARTETMLNTIQEEKNQLFVRNQVLAKVREEEAEQEKSVHKEQVEKLETEIAGLQDRLEIESEARARTETMLNTIQEEKKQLQESAREGADKAGELEAAWLQAREVGEALRGDVEALQNTLSDLQNSLAEECKERNRLSEVEFVLTEEISAMQIRMAGLEDKMKSEKAEAESELSEALSRAEVTMQVLVKQSDKKLTEATEDFTLRYDDLQARLEIESEARARTETMLNTIQEEAEQEKSVHKELVEKLVAEIAGLRVELKDALEKTVFRYSRLDDLERQGQQNQELTKSLKQEAQLATDVIRTLVKGERLICVCKRCRRLSFMLAKLFCCFQKTRCRQHRSPRCPSKW
jgi:hypothetical protein